MVFVDFPDLRRKPRCRPVGVIVDAELEATWSGREAELAGAAGTADGELSEGDAEDVATEGVAVAPGSLPMRCSRLVTTAVRSAMRRTS